jgi:lysyl-tRNA synthetase class I
MISIDEIIQAFQIPGRIIATTEEYGSGHINNTCLLQMENQDSIQKYIVRR